MNNTEKDSNESKAVETKSSLKNKVIAGVVIGGIVVAVGSNFIKPFSPKEVAVEMALDAAKSAGKYAIEKGMEKIATASTPQTQPVLPTEQASPGYVADVSSTNVIKNVESDTRISLNNVPVTAEAADTTLMNAISLGDYEQVKYVLESGVKPVFTDNKLCFVNLEGYHISKDEKDLPKDTVEMKSFIAYSSAYKSLPLTTSCSKLFLITASSKLNNQFNVDEHPYYNRAWTNRTSPETVEQEKGKIEKERIAEEIYKLVLKNTPVKDYYQLPIIFLNPKVPYSIREDALQKYMSVEGKLPVTENRQAFLKMLDATATEMIASTPNNKQLLAGLSFLKNPWAYLISVEAKNFMTVVQAYNMQAKTMNQAIAQERKFKADVGNLEVPVVGVDSLTNGGVNYTESSNAALWYYGIGIGKQTVEKYDFQPIFAVNKEIKLIKAIIDSKKVNLNYQDYQANSVLHYLSRTYNYGPRPVAILTRYFLNNGVNANLMNKEGKTAFMISQEEASRNGATDNGWADISKAYSDKNYN